MAVSHYSLNTSHPNGLAILGAKCLHCYTDVYYKEGVPLQWYQTEFLNSTARQCKCKRTCCILDEDGTFRLYVDDMQKVHLGYFTFNHSNELLNIEWLNVSGSFLYVDYTVRHTEIKYRTEEESLKYIAKTKRYNKAKFKAKPTNGILSTNFANQYFEFDMDLVHALDAHEDFQSRLFYYNNNWDFS